MLHNFRVAILAQDIVSGCQLFKARSRRAMKAAKAAKFQDIASYMRKVPTKEPVEQLTAKGPVEETVQTPGRAPALRGHV